MKLLERRFLRGPNIHRTAPCFVAVLDLAGHQPIDLEAVSSHHSFMLRLGDNRFAPMVTEAVEAARLVARLIYATQHMGGSRVPYCNLVSLMPRTAHQYRLVCDYQDEGPAAEALVASMALVNALMARHSLDIRTALDQLTGLAARSPRAPKALAHRPRQGTLTPNTRQIPVVAVTGTNGKTTTTQLIAHVLKECGLSTGAATTQGIFINGQCVQTGDCSGYWSARKLLADATVEVAALETARGGILKRGLGFEHCDIGVVLNISSDHLGLDGVETLEDLAQVKGLVARCARTAAVLNADDVLCLAMCDTLSHGCRPVLFTLDTHNPRFLEHVAVGGSGAWLDADGWLVWTCAGESTRVVKAKDLPLTCLGHARYNTANALAAIAVLRMLRCEAAHIALSLTRFVSDVKSNPLRGNRFDVDGVKLIVDYAHNVVAYQAVCEMARSLVHGNSRLLGVVTSPGDRRTEDLHQIGRACGRAFDELVVYEQNPRGRFAGATMNELLTGARTAAPDKPLHAEPNIREALRRGLAAARPGDVVVFTCAGKLDDLIEGVRLQSPVAARHIEMEVSR